MAPKKGTTTSASTAARATVRRAAADTTKSRARTKSEPAGAMAAKPSPAASKTGAASTTSRAKKDMTADTTASSKSAAPQKRRAAQTQVHELAETLQVKEDESPWSEEEILEVRQILEEAIESARADLDIAERDLGELARASLDGAGDDDADVGAKTAEQVHEQALARNVQDGLVQAELALERLEAGSYGICQSCGQPIGKLRLQARPRATLCMTCQSKQDRR